MKSRYFFPSRSVSQEPRPSTNTTGGRLLISIRAANASSVTHAGGAMCGSSMLSSFVVSQRTEARKHEAPAAAGRGLRDLMQISSMHPHIPRPRRKATRTCTDTAGVVRTVHGEFMWPFTARVNEKTAPIERIAAVAICRRLRDARGRIYAPPSTANALLAGIAADDGTDCHSIWSTLDEPGALQQSSTVHVSEGSKADIEG